MKNSFARWFLGIAVLLISFGMSCTMPTTGLGGITLSIEQEISGTRNLLPGLNMEPASYIVSGIGPSGATFTPVTITGTVASIEKLIAGSWTITVDAYNADAIPTRIGTGSATVLISDGRTTEISVVVRPLSGDGILTVNVTWPSDILVNPQIVATLKPTTGAIQSITFDVGTTSANFTTNTIPAGYYTLAISLNEGTTNVAGKTELVRIIEGQTTSGTYNFTNLNPAGGTMSLTITPEMTTPFDVSINGGQSTITVGASMELTAIVSNYLGDSTYAWYVNGVDQNVSTASWTCGSEWEVGTYVIDAVVISEDGKQAGSAALQIGVDPMVYIGGGIYDQNNSHTTPGYWKDSVWIQLPTLSSYGGYVTSLATWGDDEYAGGHNIDTQGIWVPGYWKNGIWNQLPVLAENKAGNVIALHVDDTGVYAAGETISATGHNVACYWHNGNLITLAPGTYNSEVNSLNIHDGDVYVAGAQYFSAQYIVIGYWKNSVWTDVAINPIDEMRIAQILVSDTTVYCTGYRYSGHPYTPGYWENGTWIPHEPYSSIYTRPEAILMMENDLYIAYNRGDLGAGYYKNGVWHTISTLAQGGELRSLAIWRNSVFAAGRKSNQYGYSEAGYWKNDVWVSLPGPSPLANSSVDAIFLKKY